MSAVFSRNKEKRPRSSTDESNNSFVKNVTSRVSGFLPATITKWFSSPSSSNANGSAPAADVTDSSTEDEATESPVSSQPPAKRMRLSTPGNLSLFPSTDGNTVAAPLETKEVTSVPFNVIQSPPGRNTFRREPNFVSTPIRANDESVDERSDKDTSVFKPQHTVAIMGQSVATKRKSLFEALTPVDTGKRPKPTLIRDPRYPNFKPALLGSPFYHGRTMYGGAASLYINQPNIKERKTAKVNEPETSENATMSHTTRRVMDLLENYSSPLTEAKRIPKYVKPPRTAASLNVTTHNSQNNAVDSLKMQELHVPGIASMLRLKQKSRLMDTTSAARQLIASYSSASEYSPYPYSSNNAKKDENNKETTSNLTTKVKTRVTRQLRGEDVNEAPPPPIQLPNAVLQIDNLPKFTLDKQDSPAFTSVASTITSTSTTAKADVTTAAISSVFSIPYYITMSPTSTSSSKPGFTCNSRPFTFSSPVKVSSETAEICKTPPKFVFGSPDRSIDRPKVDVKNVDSSVVVGSVKETAKSVDNTKVWKCSECYISNKSNVDKCSCGRKRETTPTETPAKCSVCKLANSQPSKDKCVNCEKIQTKTTISNDVKAVVDTSQWKCSECWVGNDEKATKCVCCGAENPKKLNSTTTKSQSHEHIWKCFICWITNENNEDNCACCGTSRNFASFNKSSKCSVCKVTDSQPNNKKCVNCDKMQSSTTIKPAEPAQWKCQECWVGNEENAEKCVCCGAGNPKKQSAGTTNDADKTAGNWKCEDCWIKNNSDVDKCDACGGPRPGAKIKTKQLFGNSATKSADDVFKNIITSQKVSKWECSSCLVRNDDDKTICVCCGADREYKTQNAGVKSFNFGQNTTNTFKFGINPNFQNTNTTKMEHTSMGDDISVDQCETNNNVLDKTPTFTFTLPTKKPEDVKQTKEIKNEVPKMNFTFGIPQGTPTSATELSVSNKAEEKQSVQEVPKVDVMSSSAQSPVKPMPMLFNPPTTSTAAPSPVVLALLGSEKSNILPNSSSSLSVSATTSAPISQPENKFSFSAGGIKPSMNIFNIPVSTTSPVVVASTPSLFASTLQTAATTAVAPAMPIFQTTSSTTSTVTMFTNKDPTSSSTVSLFQKSESAAPAAPASNTATASFFSFGSNTQTKTQASAEKPKFSFSFGSGNKPEASAVFKPTFGSLADSNNTNKFALPSSNILSGGNGLSGNPIGGSNGLSTGSVTGNISTPANILGATNEMPANPMSGGNGLQSMNSIPVFGTPVIKENMWPSNNNINNNSSTNIFVSNTSSNILQKPAAFTFGSSAPFNTNNSAPAFGSNPQQQQNIFGMGNRNSGPQPSLFSSSAASPAAAAVFGAPAPAANNAPPAIPMFGSANSSATPTFGSLNQQIPSFDAPAMAPSPAAPFSFGSSQSSAVFGFGQQQQQQQQQQPQQQGGVYSFGSAVSAPPMVQFNMGSAPNTAQRRVRKAVRRNPQR